MNTVMDTRVIYITEADMKRLCPLIEGMKNSRDDLRGLQAELDHARILTQMDVPPDVITMNSKARLRDLDTGEEMIFTLVFPGNASIEHDRISVVAPLLQLVPRCLAIGLAMNSSGKCPPVPFASGSKRCCISQKPPEIFTYEHKPPKRKESYGKEKQINTRANIRLLRASRVERPVGR